MPTNMCRLALMVAARAVVVVPCVSGQAFLARPRQETTSSDRETFLTGAILPQLQLTLARDMYICMSISVYS